MHCSTSIVQLKLVFFLPILLQCVGGLVKTGLLPPLDTGSTPKFCFSDPMPQMERAEVRKLLQNAKKPSSMVDGDIFPYLYGMFDLSGAVTPIFNAIISTGIWPEPWKVETITVIPKTRSPTDLSQCRNISCTNFLSKVMEGKLLARLREEIDCDEDQYGGVRGAGVEHLLVEVWERILGGLEIPEVAVTLLGIDYEKAFNRMSHNICLGQLAAKGASQESVNLIESFLDGRSMQSRVGNVTSPKRRINSGSPQGSILGCFLFCITTQQLGSGLVNLGGPTEPTSLQDQHAESGDEEGSGDWSSAQEIPPANIEDEGWTTSTPLSTGAILRRQEESDQEDLARPQADRPHLEDSCLGPNFCFMGGRGGRFLEKSDLGET